MKSKEYEIINYQIVAILAGQKYSKPRKTRSDQNYELVRITYHIDIFVFHYFLMHTVVICDVCVLFSTL